MEAKDILFEDNLNRFLKGEMTSAEEQEFKAQLESNPDLKKKAVVMARLAKAMQQVGTERDNAVIENIKSSSKQEIENSISTLIGKEKPKVKILTFRRFIVNFSAAASILLCVFGGYKYYKYEQVTSLGQEYLAYFPASEFTRGEEDAIGDKIQTIYANISEKKDIDATIKDLSRMWDASRSDTYNEYTEYMLELGWMLANAYLRDNEKVKALEVLDTLISECPDDTAIGDKARELKQKVEKI